MQTSLQIIFTIAIFLLNSWAFYKMFCKATQSSKISLKHQLLTIGLIAGCLSIIIFANLRLLLYPMMILILLILSLIYKKFYVSRLNLNSLFFLILYTVMIYSFTNELEEGLARWLFQTNYDIPLVELTCYLVFALFNLMIALKVPKRGLEEIYYFATQAQTLLPLNIILFALILTTSQFFLFRNPKSWLMVLFLNNRYLFYLCFAIIIFSLILFMIFFTNTKKTAQTRTYLRSIHHYTQEIEHLNEELNMFRHDSLNILYSLELAIQKGEIDEIKRIYQEILVPSQQLLLDTQQQVEVLKRIKSMEVKSLIHAKLRQAVQQKIDFSIVVAEDIYFDGLANPLIFIRILSILLDNAIENSLKNVKPAICLLLTQDENQLRLVLQNTYDETSLPVEQFHQKYFTSKTDKKNHGLGLTYVHQAIKQNSHYELTTTIEQEFFTQELIVRKK